MELVQVDSGNATWTRWELAARSLQLYAASDFPPWSPSFLRSASGF